MCFSLSPCRTVREASAHDRRQLLGAGGYGLYPWPKPWGKGARWRQYCSSIQAPLSPGLSKTRGSFPYRFTPSPMIHADAFILCPIQAAWWAPPPSTDHTYSTPKPCTGQERLPRGHRLLPRTAWGVHPGRAAGGWAQDGGARCAPRHSGERGGGGGQQGGGRRMGGLVAPPGIVVRGGEGGMSS